VTLGEYPTLSAAQILEGLKRYRRIAKQDLLRAEQAPFWAKHAEARREVYGELMELAERGDVKLVIDRSLELYSQLPFVSNSGPEEHPEIKGKEDALENFFIMIGIDPKVRREARSQRPPLQ